MSARAFSPGRPLERAGPEGGVQEVRPHILSFPPTQVDDDAQSFKEWATEVMEGLSEELRDNIPEQASVETAL